MSEWVSVEDRLPEKTDEDYNGEIWVYDRTLGVTLNRVTTFEFSLAIGGVIDQTHWMPTGLTRPEPPQ